ASDVLQTIGTGAGSATIAARAEAEIASGSLEPGQRLPPVRELAAALEVSPATVAAAYRTLRQRGLVTAHGRRGTLVAAARPRRGRPAAAATCARPRERQSRPGVAAGAAALQAVAQALRRAGQAGRAGRAGRGRLRGRRDRRRAGGRRRGARRDRARPAGG